LVYVEVTVNTLTLPTWDAGAREAASIKHWCMHREKLLFAKLLSAKLLLTTLLLPTAPPRVWVQLFAHVLLHHLAWHVRP
jgi:hypothetical protein